jgi:hypothetical protein
MADFKFESSIQTKSQKKVRDSNWLSFAPYQRFQVVKIVDFNLLSSITTGFLFLAFFFWLSFLWFESEIQTGFLLLET